MTPLECSTLTGAEVAGTTVIIVAFFAWIAFMEWLDHGRKP